MVLKKVEKKSNKLKTLGGKKMANTLFSDQQNSNFNFQFKMTLQNDNMKV